MKKFTIMLIAFLSVVVTFAALTGIQSETPFKMMSKAGMVKAQKQLTSVMKAADRKSQPMRIGARKAEAVLVTPPETATVETYYTTSGKFYVAIESSWQDATSDMPTVNVAIDGTDMYIQGLAYWFPNAWIKGTIDGTSVTFASGQLVGTDDYGDEFIVGSEDGSTVADIVFNYDSENGVLTAVTAFITESGEAETLSSLYCYWSQPVFSLTEPEAPEVVVAPVDLVTDEYAMTFTDYNKAEGSASVKVGFDDSDVYFQGLSSYLPEAWVKGTLADGVVTLPGGQYFGVYGSYEMYFMDEDFTFTYDAESGTFTGEGLLYGYTGNQYTDYYTNPVLKKVVEKAAMPANPAITSLKNGQYGWYFEFSVPIVDIDGNGLLSSKLSYIIYTDTEGEIAPLTFTPTTHTRLTEDMTEIPYGFTDNYDFYNSSIYLNNLYSAKWNKIGIQSIYRGGGETNETEIQWYNIKDYTTAKTTATFNFNQMDVAVSTNESQDGDITADTTLVAETENGDIKLTITPAREEGKTATRFWSTTNGPQLRCYYNTLTIEAPENFIVTSIIFGHTGYWGGKDGGDGTKVYADSGAFNNDKSLKIATWTGEAQSVFITIDANTQINYITVTCEPAEVEEEAIDPEGITYTFDESMEGWTTIDADGDGYDWARFEFESGSNMSPRNDSQGAMYSMSYDNSFGPLTPDNYLVSPKVKLGSTFSFFALAQDASYPAEHFGVFVSTTGKKAADFDVVDEWTLTASRAKVAPRKTPGNWYQYIVDMNAFEGEEGYVAIRHFDCTDNFYMVVDDITFGTPEEYEQPVAPELVELPEGVETEEWTLCAINEDGDVDLPVKIGIDGTDMYIQGLGIDYLPEAWVKGTIDGETVTFPSGQYLGIISGWTSAYSIYLYGYSEDEEGQGFLKDITFTYDVENGRMSTDDFILLNTEKENISVYDYYYMAEILKDFNFEPVAPVVPENVEMAEYQLTAIHFVTSEDEETGEELEEEEEIAYHMNIGFDGNDVYFVGLSEDFTDAVAKGTLSEDGKTITIPANQFMGTLDIYGYYFYDYYITSMDDDFEMADLVFNYDAEAGKLTTDQLLIINGSHKTIYPYDVLYTTEITLIPDVAAVPADPIFEDYDFENGVGYNTIYVSIPTEDVEGNGLITSKIYYIVWIEKDGKEQPYTFTTDLYYEDFDEDMTEIPYLHDGYDIYEGGEIIYLEEELEELATWTKVGIQSVYYGGGVRNTSNIVWSDGSVTKPTLRGDVNGDGQVGIGDIVAITNVMAGIETNPDIIARANVNGDEEVGIGDIVTITNIMAGIE